MAKPKAPKIVKIGFEAQPDAEDASVNESAEVETPAEPHHPSLFERLTGHHSEPEPEKVENENPPDPKVPGKMRKFQ